MKYNFKKIETKWQKEWAKNKYKNQKAQDFSKKRKIYILDMFPYPSGAGLHVGHIEGYTGSDILSRYYRLKGFNVLHPIGYDAFGLPAEQYAIAHKINPTQAVKENIKNFERQLKMMGFSYDWSRTINTTSPEYYKWTQWIFLQLYKKGLAYESEVPVNYCDKCKAVLADEETENGKCFRCGGHVSRVNIKQWMLKITAYADRLLRDLNKVNFSENVKTMQKNWIGKSEGYEVTFKVIGAQKEIKVFTTRLDTLFGATYLVLAPEHPIIKDIVSKDQEVKVEEYIKKSLNKTDFERQVESKTKTGVATGAFAINPGTREHIPIWVSDYVLMSYGTGAIMAVPAHDQRDYDFAQTFNLNIRQVIKPFDNTNNTTTSPFVYDKEGVLINSGPFTGVKSTIAREKIALYVGAQKKINYKMRDWVFSRQRYWGEPIPIIKCPKCGNVPLREKDLPLKLPNIKCYAPSKGAESPLENISSWVNVKCPICNSDAKRETNTMPQWAGSSWYFLRFLDPKNHKMFVSLKKEKYWMPVDIYIGGTEHAVTHLIYARFWYKFLYDLGYVNYPEPFVKLINQGMILGADHEKMSKSLGNVVNPDDIVKQYGVDALRLYEMFLGAFNDAKPWNTNSFVGIERFLNKIWNLYDEYFNTKNEKPHKKVNTKKFEIIINKTIKKVEEDISTFGFNTAISAMMECLNVLTDNDEEIKFIPKSVLEKFIIILSPFAPFITEEIWHEMFKNKTSIQKAVWPKYNIKLVEDKNIIIAVQINGKMKGTLQVKRDSREQDVLTLLNKDKKLSGYVLGHKIKKTIFIPNRLINILLE